jgi:hypothetical protein
MLVCPLGVHRLGTSVAERIMLMRLRVKIQIRLWWVRLNGSVSGRSDPAVLAPAGLARRLRTPSAQTLPEKVWQIFSKLYFYADHHYWSMGRVFTLKISQSFKIGDGLFVPENRDMLSQLLIGMLCHGVASSKGRIVSIGGSSKGWIVLQKRGRYVTGTHSPGIVYVHLTLHTLSKQVNQKIYGNFCLCLILIWIGKVKNFLSWWQFCLRWRSELESESEPDPESDPEPHQVILREFIVMTIEIRLLIEKRPIY